MYKDSCSRSRIPSVDFFVKQRNVVEEKIFKAIELESLTVDKIVKLTKLDIVMENLMMSFFEISGRVEKARGWISAKVKLEKMSDKFYNSIFKIIYN